MAKKLASQPIGVRSSLVTSHAHAQVHHELERFFAAPDDRVFYCNDGASVNSIGALASHLRTMNGHVYASHANDYKNDFSAWLRDVHKEHELADRLICAKNKDHAAKIITNHIVAALHDAAHRSAW